MDKILSKQKQGIEIRLKMTNQLNIYFSISNSLEFTVNYYNFETSKYVKEHSIDYLFETNHSCNTYNKVILDWHNLKCYEKNPNYTSCDS